MSEKTITFLGSRGNGMSSDMALVKEYLREQDSEYSFRFFVKNERTKNTMAGLGFTKAKMSFCEDAENIICVDGSLSTNLKKVSKEGVKLLMAAPYEYQFKNALLSKKKELNIGTLKKYTHILSGSPFTTELLKQSYRLDEAELIEGCVLPLAWEVIRPEKQQEKRELLSFYFPAIREKKVVSLLVYGNGEEEDVFDDFDLKAFLHGLGEEWFFVTNSKEIMQKAGCLSARYRESFGFLYRVLPAQELLYVSDMLITNNGRMASVFAARKKPVYCMAYRDNYFEQYMKEMYPNLYLLRPEDLALTDYEAFFEKFSYEAKESPYSVLDRLLKRDA